MGKFRSWFARPRPVDMWRYAPSLDPRSNNILLSGSQNVVPTNAGGFRDLYTSIAGTSQPGYPALAAACVGSRYLLRQDGTDRLFAGTATKLYEANQTVSYAWTDVARGANYSGVTQWMFEAYGDTMLAAASLGTHTEIQASTGAVGTAFANLTNAPKAKIIVVQDNALYAFNYDTGGGAIPDGWIRTDSGNITNWTTGSGDCVSGRFTETPGSITAAIKQGNGVVVFKDRGMWRGQYVGLYDGVVRWELVTPSVGCVGPLAVANVEDVLYFADAQGFWKYDGTRPVPLSQDLADEWRTEFTNGTSPEDVELGVDDVSNIIYIYLPKTSGAHLAAYPFNYRTGAFGPPARFTYYTSDYAKVEAVCNGSYNKIHLMPGMASVTTVANNYVFSSADHKMRLFYAGTLDAQGSFSAIMKYNYFGQHVKANGLSRIYHDVSYGATANDGTVSWSEAIIGYRHPFSSSPVSQPNSVTMASGDGFVDIVASGHWYALTSSITKTCPAIFTTAPVSNLRWYGFEPGWNMMAPGR